MKRSGLLILAESPKSRAWCCADVEAMVVNALFDTGSSFGLFRRDAYSGPYGYARSYTCSYGNARADCNARADSYARAYGHTHAAADSNPSARRNPPDRGARRDPGSDSDSPGPGRRPDGNFRDRRARSP